MFFILTKRTTWKLINLCCDEKLKKWNNGIGEDKWLILTHASVSIMQFTCTNDIDSLHTDELTMEKQCRANFHTYHMLNAIKH